MPLTVNGLDTVRITPRFRSYATYEPDLWTALMSALKPGDTFLDVGANVGLYSVAAGLRLVDGAVVAVEPDPVNAELLRKHIAMNGVADRIDVVEAAATDHTGTMRFAARSSPVSGHVDTYDSPTTRVIDVQCITVDDLLPTQSVDIMKIDVEGAEQLVLTGARRLFRDAARRPRAVFVEVHPEACAMIGIDQETLVASLTDVGYEPRLVSGEAIGRFDARAQWRAEPVIPATSAYPRS